MEIYVSVLLIGILFGLLLGNSKAIIRTYVYKNERIKFSEKNSERLEALAESTPGGTIEDVFRQSLQLYEFVLEEVTEKESIFFIQRKDKEFPEELEMIRVENP